MSYEQHVGVWLLDTMFIAIQSSSRLGCEHG